MIDLDLDLDVFELAVMIYKAYHDSQFKNRKCQLKKKLTLEKESLIFQVSQLTQ